MSGAELEVVQIVAQGQIYRWGAVQGGAPPPPSGVQHPLHENSDIPYLSCEHY
jgi:hypothetical protein